MKKGNFSLFLLLLIFVFGGCNSQNAHSPEEMKENSGTDNNPPVISKEEDLSPAQDPLQEQSAMIFAMDTVMNVKIHGGSSEMLKKMESQVLELENLFSTTKAESDISRINQDGHASVADDTGILLGKALDLCAKTKGDLDISIYPIVKAWGFTTGRYQVPTDTEIQTLLSKVDYRKILHSGSSVSIEEGMQIDLGSVAKGYTADKMVQFLKDNAIHSALINLGGNVHAHGTKPDGSKWRIAVQDPKSSDLLGTVAVSDMAVVTSGGYERYFEENGKIYWHIMDPKTGRPADSGLISVTIVCPSGLYADALSTSLFIKGLEKSISFWKEHQDFEAVFVDAAGSIFITEGLENSFSLLASAGDQGYEIIRKD